MVLGITTNGRVPSLEEAKDRFESSWSKACEASREKSSPKAIELREWGITLLRYRGEFLGYVKADSREAAESEAARLFGLTEFSGARCSCRSGFKKSRPIVRLDRGWNSKTAPDVGFQTTAGATHDFSKPRRPAENVDRSRFVGMGPRRSRHRCDYHSDNHLN